MSKAESVDQGDNRVGKNSYHVAGTKHQIHATWSGSVAGSFRVGMDLVVQHRERFEFG